MIGHMALLVTIVAAWFSLLATPLVVRAQDTTDECASATWLAPLAATPEPKAPAQTTGEAPRWLTTELTDACSGEAFTLADFAGKTLYVESMATWCGECYGQLTRVQEAFAQIPEAEQEDIVLVALSSEIDLPREDLARYADKTGFPLIFAVMPEEMLIVMAQDVGREWAIPPAMPHLIVAPDGTIGELHTGGSSAEELLALLAEVQASTSP
jgi:hypothetical protein